MSPSNSVTTELDGGASNDPDVLEQLSAPAQRVTAAEREPRTLTLRLIRRW
jgi:hypothetical protein